MTWSVVPPGSFYLVLFIGLLLVHIGGCSGNSENSGTELKGDPEPLIRNDNSDDFVAEKYGVYYASKCETCRIVAHELDLRLKETGKTHETLGTVSSGHKKYVISELRLIETLEGICERMLSYTLHKEHKNIQRFAKGQSTTMSTLHNLVAKGVQVDIGIPGELWDKPSVEITQLKTDCESLIEDYEGAIEEWYESGMLTPLEAVLCTYGYLLGMDQSCLDQPFDPEPKKQKTEL